MPARDARREILARILVLENFGEQLERDAGEHPVLPLRA